MPSWPATAISCRPEPMKRPARGLPAPPPARSGGAARDRRHLRVRHREPPGDPDREGGLVPMKPTPPLPCLAGLIALVLSGTVAYGSPPPTGPDSPGATPDSRLAWFREAKYGLFIHFGLYAIPAGEWKGKTIPGIGEWIMNRAKIPVTEYELLAKQFNPVKFNADEWFQLAQDAGMKYMVITSKHHDGFALFDSKVSTWDIVDATPFKRDLLKELSRLNGVAS